MVIKTIEGTYVEFGNWETYTVSKEEREAINKQQAEAFAKKLAEEKDAKAVPQNNYHIGTIKKIYKTLGYELKSVFGGYKGGRYQPRQKYDVIENFGEKRIILENKDYFELGQILEQIGAL